MILGVFSYLPLTGYISEDIISPKEILNITEVMTKSRNFPSALICKMPQGYVPLEMYSIAIVFYRSTG